MATPSVPRIRIGIRIGKRTLPRTVANLREINQRARDFEINTSLPSVVAGFPPQHNLRRPKGLSSENCCHISVLKSGRKGPIPSRRETTAPGPRTPTQNRPRRTPAFFYFHPRGSEAHSPRGNLFLNAAGKPFLLSGSICSEEVRPAEIRNVGAYTQEFTVRALLYSDPPPPGRLDPSLTKARRTLFAFSELRVFAAGMVFFFLRCVQTDH